MRPPYYHCVSHCVRRAFLCGDDQVSGENYEHRRGWLENKLLELPQIFAIQIAAYAIMSNHYHVVLFVDSATSKAWVDIEVVERWHQLFNGNLLSQKFCRGETLSVPEMARLQIYIAEWRSRLADISCCTVPGLGHSNCLFQPDSQQLFLCLTTIAESRLP